MAAWQDEVAELRQRRPAHVLFLCVANSARSQLAEGLARSLAPEGTRVSSAGAYPARLHEQAAEALREIGIDPSGQYAKGLDQVDVGSVDAVITLCAEQVCPRMPGDVARLHWPMPDPTAGGLAGFREVRDELRRRLAALFE